MEADAEHNIKVVVHHINVVFSEVFSEANVFSVREEATDFGYPAWGRVQLNWISKEN